ncbi:43533_t:CDS:1, partial [Gigaspora margarita]
DKAFKKIRKPFCNLKTILHPSYAVRQTLQILLVNNFPIPITR